MNGVTSVFRDLEEEATEQFILSLAPSPPDDSLSEFVTCVIVLLPSDKNKLATATLQMVKLLLLDCSSTVRLNLVKADLIPRLITHLHPLSVSFPDFPEIPSHLTAIIDASIWLGTQVGLGKLGIEDADEQNTINQTCLKQILIASERYLHHLCGNSDSIVDPDFSFHFERLLGRLLRICPFHPPTMHFVHTLPIYPTIARVLTTLPSDASLWIFLYEIVTALQEWNKQGGFVRQAGKTVQSSLRSDGLEDVIEQKLTTDFEGFWGREVAKNSILLNNLVGMNVPALK
ncbi:hypothetical protein BLNAU_15124 [Blattamonas nauphoetae]|uniref:Uncharacterized protein n=1 Tax=Blattamonas nauphoetae TaxID=2049346 RepID=A0ABQ9XDG2_9EUKA|nr:hypothetical protein BLNAU_15124 [Blattamonas nauphoetae]